ncbi:MAG: STAS domain-containing protein [Thermoanaerobaculales bacterium]|jgi:anti-sigma B factor antagonist|nr:STAS domain-containing protein [Thermoanaerobaculales bacterium]
MHIERVEQGPVTIVVVQGVIRLGESATTFSNFLREVLEEGSKPVIVDLEGIDHVDSTGLGELVGHLQRFEEQGRRMAFVNPARRLRKLFQLTRLDEVVPIYDDRASAVAALTDG